MRDSWPGWSEPERILGSSPRDYRGMIANKSVPISRPPYFSFNFPYIVSYDRNMWNNLNKKQYTDKKQGVIPHYKINIRISGNLAHP
jgi:hypothetical protein